MTLQDIKESIAKTATDPDGYYLPDHILLKVDGYVTTVADVWGDKLKFELAKCQTLLESAESRVKLCQSQYNPLVERKDHLEEWLIELRDNLKNGNTIDNYTLSNEINELLNES